MTNPGTAELLTRCQMKKGQHPKTWLVDGRPITAEELEAVMMATVDDLEASKALFYSKAARAQALYRWQVELDELVRPHMADGHSTVGEAMAFMPLEQRGRVEELLALLDDGLVR